MLKGNRLVYSVARHHMVDLIYSFTFIFDPNIDFFDFHMRFQDLLHFTVHTVSSSYSHTK